MQQVQHRPLDPRPMRAPFISRRVTVSGLSWPMRWLRPMACRSKLGLSVGSHRLRWEGDGWSGGRLASQRLQRVGPCTPGHAECNSAD